VFVLESGAGPAILIFREGNNIQMNTVISVQSTDWDSAAYAAVRDRAAGTNLDPVTLLATDYLNHFNEIVMLLEMVPDMPEILEDAQEWQPKPYVAHFETSTIADKDLAIEAYAHVPPEFKTPFEETVQLIDILIVSTVQQLDEKLKAGETDLAREIAVARSRNIQRLMDVASAIMHGATETLAQDEIDRLMGN